MHTRYNKVSSTELAEHIWNNISLLLRYEFCLSDYEILDPAKTDEFSVAMMIVSGNVMIVANCYGGGNPFCFTVKKQRDKDTFITKFCEHIHKVGQHFWLNPAPFEVYRTQGTKPLEIGLRSFAEILLENSDRPLEIKFQKAEPDEQDTYANETYTFVFTDVAETIIGVCNSDSRVMQFCTDVSDEGCISSFVSDFVKYLKGCGFEKNVLAFVNRTMR